MQPSAKRERDHNEPEPADDPPRQPKRTKLSPHPTLSIQLLRDREMARKNESITIKEPADVQQNLERCVSETLDSGMEEIDVLKCVFKVICSKRKLSSSSSSSSGSFDEIEWLKQADLVKLEYKIAAAQKLHDTQCTYITGENCPVLAYLIRQNAFDGVIGHSGGSRSFRLKEIGALFEVDPTLFNKPKIEELENPVCGFTHMVYEGNADRYNDLAGDLLGKYNPKHWSLEPTIMGNVVFFMTFTDPQ